MMACANANAVDADSVAGKQRDSLCVSLLTCSPGDIAYTMYGHSAIRVHNITTRKDLVFNYGMFNFDEDNFIYKFVKGETDYILGAEPADFFFGRYRERGIGIVEQSLNFTQDECWHLYEILWTNIQPQNRTYRYNWLYDNCTTRARDAIERAVNGHVVYKSRPEAGTDMTTLSARRMLHPFARADRWVEFGQNFVLGYEIDRPLAMRQTMFLPHKFKDYASGAVIVQEALTDAGDTILNEIPLISTTHDVLKPVAADSHTNIDSPLMCFLLLFIITLVLNAVIKFVGEDRFAGLILNRPVLGELIAGLVGLVPNCAASVVITELYLEGAMSVGAMLSGLLVGSGVGLLVLFRMNRDVRDNVKTLVILYVIGVVCGYVLGLLPIF